MDTSSFKHIKILSAQDTDNAPKLATVGVFDGVHYGHRALLHQVSVSARHVGAVPTVVTFTSHPQNVVAETKVKMLSTLDERISDFKELGIECVILLDFNKELRNMTAEQFITMLHDRYNVIELLVGFNNRFGKDRQQGFDEYKSIGERIGVKVWRFHQFLRGSIAEGGKKVSSSIIRKLLEEGKVEDAADMLRRYYSITGKVVHGKELGRTIGFPTANIECINPATLVPGNGVYAVNVVLPDGTVRRGMLNIGHRPTVDSPDAPRSLEVHIIDYKGDLYGKIVTLQFIKYLRPERSFQSIEALRAQLSADAAQVTALHINN